MASAKSTSALVAGMLATTLIVADSELAGAALLTSALISVVAGVLAGRSLPKGSGSPWFGFSLAIVLFVSGHSIGEVSGDPGSGPGMADAFFTCGYLALNMSAIALIRLRGRYRRRADMVDALIVAVGLGIALWALLLGPIVYDESRPFSERLFNAVYFALSLSLLALTSRLAVGPGAKSPAYYFLGAAFTSVFLLEVAYILDDSGVFTNDLVTTLSALTWTLGGAGALHPSRSQLCAPSDDGGARSLTGRRLLVLGLALMMAPLVLFISLWSDRSVDLPLLAIGSAALAILVLSRVASLYGVQLVEAEQERRLGGASREIMAAGEAREIRAAVICGTEDFLAGVNAQIAYVTAMGRGEDRTLTVDSEWHGLASEVAANADRFVVLNQLLMQGASVASHTLDGADEGPYPEITLVTAQAFGGDREAVAVFSPRRLESFEVRPIEVLVREGGLALRNLELREQLVRERAERRFRALVETSSDVLIVLDSERRISFASPALEGVLGYDVEETLGTKAHQLVHPDDAEAARSVIAALADRSSSGPVEVRLLAADGTTPWFELTCNDLSDDPEIGGPVVNAREITDRRLAEQRVMANEARFRALVQHSSDLVAVIDADGVFTYASPSIRALIGVDVSEAVGSGYQTVFDGPADTIKEMLADPPKDKRRERATVEVRDGDGRRHELDFTLTDLREDPAVAGLVLNARDVTAQRALEEDLRFQALHDPLTALPNRKFFERAIDRALQERVAPAMPAVIFLDIDDFKTVNDGLGHAAGDQLLVSTAARIRSVIRLTDTAARFGGDEFAVFLPECLTEREAGEVAQRILDALAEPVMIGQREISVRASAGVTVAKPGAMSSEILLRRSDTAMYAAKRSGKGRVELFSTDSTAAAIDRLDLVNDLRRSIADDQLAVHFQPVFELANGALAGSEALVRWNHPERGVVGPNIFIPLAEESGFILELGPWVLRTALAQLAQWTADRMQPGWVSVNLSMVQLNNPETVTMVQTAIDDHGVDPGLLKLELTESVAMTDDSAVVKALVQLRALGVAIAVDDFGTGYSSLSRVREHPFDVIKIDRSFVDALDDGDPEANLVIEKMIEIALGLGVDIVAEGIESLNQLETVRRLGCQFGQGYYFAKPMPATDMGSLLAKLRGVEPLALAD